MGSFPKLCEPQASNPKLPTPNSELRMGIQTSVVAELCQALPDVRSQIYFKSSLTALSHATEDRVLASSDRPLLIACFQRERYYRQEAHRYRRLAGKTDQIYILAAPETDFRPDRHDYIKIPLPLDDALAQEWHLVVIGEDYASCLVCRECEPTATERETTELDSARRFEGIWTLERRVSLVAADILLRRILHYRPELSPKIEAARSRYLPDPIPTEPSSESNTTPFVERLVTHLQADQYKLMRAYRAIALKERQERLIHALSATIRRSLDPDDILAAAVTELGKTLGACRCLIYRARTHAKSTPIAHEYRDRGVVSLQDRTWQLSANPLIARATEEQESLHIEDTSTDDRVKKSPWLRNLVAQTQIQEWMLVPVVYQGQLMGMVELHRTCPATIGGTWKPTDVELVEAIATQVGIALTQAEAYKNLEDLNEQLEALERTRSNLVAITGHELRTPLSTIQVCLESLATEPEMSLELRQVMLNTALNDAERMRSLIQDFLTLSRLESGRVEWNPEPLSLRECVELSLSNTLSRSQKEQMPAISFPLPEDLPLVQADGEWLVEVLAKLLDNACKFTDPDGEITLSARESSDRMVEVVVADNGRGIEPNRLERVFDRFYQEESALQRTTGGTGIGLAICRQIVGKWGGQIWAESAGRDNGTQFHFTIPIYEEFAGVPAE